MLQPLASVPQRIAAAQAVAAHASRTTEYNGGRRVPVRHKRALVIGDPQAPIDKFFRILDAHGLLAEDGHLRPDLHLISIGDHFDWGEPTDRERAARSGLELLSWLAAHPPDRVTLILGNHDLARVGELVSFDDATFAVAQSMADAHQESGASTFHEHYPNIPTAEVLSRDFATFRQTQRVLVASLLKARRFAVAVDIAPDLLVCHAGVTIDDLSAIDAPPAESCDAHAVARALNDALDHAVSTWTDGGPLQIPFLHAAGAAKGQEGRGIFYHRPANPALEKDASLFAGPPRRRFDPRRLPRSMTQVIGHSRDKKCRELLGPWASDQPAVDGPLRHLVTDGRSVRYARGAPLSKTSTGSATMVFVDGGMDYAPLEAYELYDLVTGLPAARLPGASPAH